MSTNNTSAEGGSDAEWKQRALETLRTFYLQFRGSQWDEYNVQTELDYLLAKICMATFGAPTEEPKEDEPLYFGYEEKQRDFARKMRDKLLEVMKKDEKSKGKEPAKLLVGIIFICCKHPKGEYPQPIFSLFLSGDPSDPAKNTRRYIDTHLRVYSTWDDWKSNNTQPANVQYAYPRRGFFTSSKLYKYEFDPAASPDIEFGISPASTTLAKVFRGGDIAGVVTSLGCAAIGIASMFTPIGPAILAGSLWVGSGSAVYCGGRAINRLTDKGQHGESMFDLESVTLYLSIAALPLNFGSSVLNARLVQGAVTEGRIFSQTTRMVATFLNFSKLTADAALLSCGIANLIEKAKNKQLNALDVLQFSISVFFFTNTLMQPKLARTIIEQAQDAHIQNYAASMSQEEAKATFDRFYADNIKRGGIHEKSKIVRTINRIDNPEAVFGGLKDAAKIDIGGRKGKTLLVTNQNEATTTRINPSKVTFNQKTYTPIKFSSTSNRIKNVFKRDPSKMKMNGKRIFDENSLTERQKARLVRMAKQDDEIIRTSFEVAERMNCDSADALASIVEIVAADVKQQQGTQNISKADALANIQANQKSFIDGICKDIDRAGKITSTSKFEDSLQAVHHYRKHGAEFTTKGQQQSIDVYLQELPDALIQECHLFKWETCSDGTTLKYYMNGSNQLAVVAEHPDVSYIKTIFQKGSAVDGLLANSMQKSSTPTPATRTQAQTFADSFNEALLQLTKDALHIIGAEGFKIFLKWQEERQRREEETAERQ